MKSIISICFLTFLFSLSYAQKVVRGVVTDEKGGVPGVSVIQKGTTNGTVTNLSGAFTINVNLKKEQTLRFSMVGYQTQEVNITNQTTVNIRLSEDVKSLEEVVVVGYGTQRKVSVTGAITNIGGKELTQTPVSSVTNALTGRVSGLITRQESGRPGGDAATLFVRGRASLNSSSPLVLVDGVERSFSQINSEDVESISILKDASATAVYGVRGANGVVLVTTKRGFNGKARIGLIAEYGITNYNRLTEALNSETTSRFQREGTINMGLDPSQISNTGNFPVSEYDNYLYRTQLSPFTHPDNNFVSTFTKPGNQQKYNVNITGGNNAVKYFVSVGYFTQDGMFQTDVNKLRETPTLKRLIELSPAVDSALVRKNYNPEYSFHRLSTRSNVDITFTEDFKMGVNMSYLFRQNNRPATYDNDGLSGDGQENLRLFAAFYRNSPQAFPLMNPNGSFAASSGLWRQNPLVTLAYTGFRTGYDNQLETSFTFNYNLRKIAKGFSVDGRYAYDADWNSYRGMIWRPYLYSFNSADQSYTQGLAGLLPEQGSRRRAAAYDQYMELALRYKGTFGGKHNLSAVALTNRSSDSAPGIELYSYVPHIYQALIGRVNYDYDNRYLFEANMGYNGSNRFQKGHRYQLFPSASVGWIITNEKFIPKNDWLDFAKIRGSVGQVGNDDLGGFSYYYKSSYENGASYSFGETNNPAVTGTREGRNANENVRWETSTKYNAGIDTRWFNSRLSLTVDAFKEHRTNILAYPGRYVQAAGVRRLAPENIGIVDNKGYELELGWDDKIGDDFSYFTKVIYSNAKNTIREMSEAVQPYEYGYATGRSIDQFIGYKFDGFFESYEQIAASPQQFGLANLAPGDIKYKDLNQDGIIDQNDRTAIGHSTVPETTYSLALGFRWKGFDTNVLFQGAATSSVYMVGDLGWDNNWGNYYPEHYNRWTPETAATASYPRFLQKALGSNQNYYLSDFWLIDGSYLRLKNVELGYTFKKGKLKGTPLNSVRLYANAFNLVTWDKVKRVDPESKPDGNDGQFYPQQWIMNFGLNVNF